MLEKLETFPAKRTLLIITVVAFVAFIILNLVMYPYTAATADVGAPGVIDFELTWGAARAQEIMIIWSLYGLETGQFILNLIDLAYMPAYAFFIGGAVLFTVRKLPEGALRRFGLVATVLPFAAWACDLIENINLLQMFAINIADISDINAITASIAATIKFTFLIIAIGTFAINLVVMLLPRGKGRAPPTNK